MKTRILFLIAFSAISALLTASLASTPVLVSVSVTPANPSIADDTNFQLTATGTYSDASTADLTTQVAWASDNPSAIVVNGDGLAHGVNPGSATITATAPGGTSGSTTVTVAAALIISLDVYPASASIPAGTTEQFQAIGTWSDGLTTQDVTATVSWSSSDPTIALVSNSAFSQGLATGVSTGQVTITATLGTLTNSSDLTVTSPYSIAPFQQPINDPISVNNPMSVFRVNSTVPVKFQLTNESGNPLDDSDASAIAANCQATISLQYLSSATGAVDETVNSTTANSGNCFRYDSISHSFTFNLGTRGLSSGTYTITATVTGSFAATHSVNVGLR
jgi:Bacterial Ig-like domain (group 2)